MSDNRDLFMVGTADQSGTNYTVKENGEIRQYSKPNKNKTVYGNQNQSTESKRHLHALQGGKKRTFSGVILTDLKSEGDVWMNKSNIESAKQPKIKDESAKQPKIKEDLFEMLTPEDRKYEEEKARKLREIVEQRKEKSYKQIVKVGIVKGLAITSAVIALFVAASKLAPPLPNPDIPTDGIHNEYGFDGGIPYQPSDEERRAGLERFLGTMGYSSEEIDEMLNETPMYDEIENNKNR